MEKENGNANLELSDEEIEYRKKFKEDLWWGIHRDYDYENYENKYKQEIKELQNKMRSIMTLAQETIDGPFGVLPFIVQLATDLKTAASSLGNCVSAFRPPPNILP